MFGFMGSPPAPAPAASAGPAPGGQRDSGMHGTYYWKCDRCSALTEVAGQRASANADFLNRKAPSIAPECRSCGDPLWRTVLVQERSPPPEFLRSLREGYVLQDAVGSGSGDEGRGGEGTGERNDGATNTGVLWVAEESGNESSVAGEDVEDLATPRLVTGGWLAV